MTPKNPAARQKETMTIDELIDERNRIQLIAENISEEVASTCWLRHGIANRHIERLVSGQMQLSPGVEREIKYCLEQAEDYAMSQKPV